MAQAAEQLIRDYLNRLSVAARGQLDPADRRSLVSRTHDFIERKTGLSGRPADPMEVGRLLTRLGDPAGLVRLERQRLAAVRGAESAEAEPPGRGKVARVLRREAGRPLGATWHWPSQESRDGLRLTLLEGGRSTKAGRRGTSPGLSSQETAGSADLAEVPAEPGDTPAAPPAASAPRPRRAQWPSLVSTAEDDDMAGRAENGRAENGRADTGRADTGHPDTVIAGTVVPPGVAPDGADARPEGADEPDNWLLAEFASPDRVARQAQGSEAVARVAELAGGLVRRMLAFWRGNPVEVTAVLLLGLGGVIFPPVWLLGAALALASRVWDFLDKWTGLAVPVLLTIVGVALGIMHGGHSTFGHDVHEAWAFGVLAARVSAVLSACYLGWRAWRGRRPPADPPWSKQRRLS